MEKKETVELLDPKSDVVFKAIFSQDNELAHGARNSLISSFIGREVKESVIAENELSQVDIHAKKVRLDLHCVLDNKSHVIVEMQSRPTADDIKNRVTYYGSRSLGNQKVQGGFYSNLKPVYILMLNDYVLFPNEPYLAHFSILSKNTGDSLCDLLHFYFLQLKKIPNTCKIKAEMNALLQWTYFFNNKSIRQLEKMTEVDKGVLMAETLLSRISQDEIQRIKILQEEMAVNDYYSGINFARKQGLEQGRNEGLEQGRVQERIKTARSMKSEGLSPEQIKRFTGLSEGEY